VNRRSLLLVRWGVFIAACGFLYLRLARHQSTHDLWGEWTLALQRAPMLPLAWVALLMVVNWGIEAWKWRDLMDHVEDLSFGRAFTATIAGTSLGLITPNRVGEFAGRVLFLAPEHRWQGGFATALGSIAQFVVTLVVGGLALGAQQMFALRASRFGDLAIYGWLALIALVAGGAIVLFFTPRLLRQLLLKLPVLSRWERASAVLEGYSMVELARVLGLSALRYVVFALQFMIVLATLAGVPYTTSLFAVPIIYLMTTLVPTVMLTELGVRGSVAVAVLDQHEVMPGAILLASMLVWLVNLALPAIIGSVILLMARIRTSE
jgi:uncharacterized membrane protein